MAQYDNMHDDLLIDLTMKAAYKNFRMQVNIGREVFKPNGFELSRRQISRLTRIMVATGLLKAHGGYGDDSRIALTDDGILIMRKHGGYFEFLSWQRDVQTNLNNSEMLTTNVKTAQNNAQITPQIGKSFWHEHPWAKAILWIIAVIGGIATTIGVILQI